MQRIATRIFIYASIVFGVLGIFIAFTNVGSSDKPSGFELVVTKLFVATIFVILTSFALSVAGKYLNGKF